MLGGGLTVVILNSHDSHHGLRWLTGSMEPSLYIEVSWNGDTPGHGWFVEENPIETDEFGVPLCPETTIYCL